MDFAEVIGDPISHSKSPLIHKYWLDSLGIVADYRACHVKPDALQDYVKARRKDPNWRGCNVTIPHKLAIMDLVADTGEVRSSIGAMNTVARDKKGDLFGTNTDAAGFFAPIADLPIKGTTAIVIGTGGAAHAVLFALAQCGIGSVTLLARNPLKGAALLARFGLKGRVLPLDAPLPPAQLLVNASPLGMIGQAPLTLPLTNLPEECVVYDLVYQPRLTPLLREAQTLGLECVDGLEMLIGQAALAFELFFGVAPPRDDTLLRAKLVA